MWKHWELYFFFVRKHLWRLLPKTIISREYSSEWKAGDEPYYPVNDEKNGQIYAKYKVLTDK